MSFCLFFRYLMCFLYLSTSLGATLWQKICISSFKGCLHTLLYYFVVETHIRVGCVMLFMAYLCLNTIIIFFQVKIFKHLKNIFIEMLVEIHVTFTL